MDYYNHILQLNKYKLNVSTTPKIRSLNLGWIEQHLSHRNLIKTRKPSLVFLGDSIPNGFKRYGNIWDNQFGKQTVNCGIKGDRTKNLIQKIEEPVIPKHVRRVVIICRTNNLERDKPKDITNVLICAAILILWKQKQIKIIVHVMVFSQGVEEIALEDRNYYRLTLCWKRNVAKYRTLHIYKLNQTGWTQIQSWKWHTFIKMNSSYRRKMSEACKLHQQKI